MKSIYNKVHFSSLFLLVMFLSLLSGLFRDVITLFMVIIIHELGHLVISFLFGWKVKRIDIGICGGYITYDENIDKPFLEEFLIAVSGITFQTLFYLLVIIMYNLNILDEGTLFLVRKYHYAELIFNLLPIIPLDGSKMVLVLLNIIMPYKKTLVFINGMSWITILVITCLFLSSKLKMEYSYIMIISFIISKLINFAKETPYLFNRFLFERYRYPIDVKKYVHVKDGDLGKFRRQRKHYFLINNHYYHESKILAKRFD